MAANFKHSDIALNNSEVIGKGVFLGDINDAYDYVDGKRGDRVGTRYTCSSIACKLKQFDVVVKGPQQIPTEILEKQGLIQVKFKDLSLHFTGQGPYTFGISGTASSIEVMRQ